MPSKKYFSKFIDFNKYDWHEFKLGYPEEKKEHANLHKNKPKLIASIVTAHLDENPEYYTILKKAFK
jgi:hypothetical protein